MTTINELIWKYKSVETLFMSPEITKFKTLLLKFKEDQNSLINTLEAMQLSRTPDLKLYEAEIQLLKDIIGRDYP
jgi:hypothetical protein